MRILALATMALTLALGAAQALAHPHVWVAVRSDVLFDGEGRVAGVRHAWAFDDMYSAYVTMGLGKDGKPPTREELAPIARTNAEQLKDFDYFTFAKSGGTKLAFGAATDYWLEARDDKVAVLHFTLPLEKPLKLSKPFSLQVYDPSYFISLEFEKTDAVKLENAPAGCSQSLSGAGPLSAEDEKARQQSLADGLAPQAPGLALKLAARVIVACP
jgi:ABC-type uncharacterized transport system substrate-binding protein